MRMCDRPRPRPLRSLTPRLALIRTPAQLIESHVTFLLATAAGAS
jgi:hypothetical protein